jgi:hypothetical protein
MLLRDFYAWYILMITSKFARNDEIKICFINQL